jgi:hypothetical protein
VKKSTIIIYPLFTDVNQKVLLPPTTNTCL